MNGHVRGSLDVVITKMFVPPPSFSETQNFFFCTDACDICRYSFVHMSSNLSVWFPLRVLTRPLQFWMISSHRSMFQVQFPSPRVSEHQCRTCIDGITTMQKQDALRSYCFQTLGQYRRFAWIPGQSKVPAKVKILNKAQHCKYWYDECHWPVYHLTLHLYLSFRSDWPNYIGNVLYYYELFTTWCLTCCLYLYTATEREKSVYWSLL